jgi:hypothetical protein
MRSNNYNYNNGNNPVVFASYETNYAGLDSRAASFNSRLGDGTGLAPPTESLSLNGYLYKQSSSGEWQKRYFELNGSYLCYYKNNKMTKLLAAINIPQVGRIALSGEVNDNLGDGYIFRMDLKDRQYLLRTDSFQEAKRWVDILTILRDSGSDQSLNPLSNVYSPGAAYDAKRNYSPGIEPQAVVYKQNRFQLLSCCMRS